MDRIQEAGKGGIWMLFWKRLRGSLHTYHHQTMTKRTYQETMQSAIHESALLVSTPAKPLFLSKVPKPHPSGSLYLSSILNLGFDS